QRASVVDALEVLDGDLSVEIPRGGQPAWRLLPAVFRRYAADRVPLSLEKIELPFPFHAQPPKIRYGPAAVRVSVAIQFNSHVFPPSSENACSNRHEFESSCEMTNRTRIARPPSRVSTPKNSPRPFLNSPYTGGLRVPPLTLEK